MIERITLRNFKTFRNSSIPLGPVTIVLGANGSGKSNFFDALRFLKSIGDGRSVRDAIEGHISPGGSITATAGIRGGNSTLTHFLDDSTEFELEVAIRTRGDRINYYVRVDAARYRVVHEELSSHSHPAPYVYSTKPKSGPLKQDPESPIVRARFYKAVKGLNPGRDFSPHEFILSQFVSRRAESRINENVARLARNEFSAIRPLELRPEVLRQYSPLGRFDLGEHGENFSAVVWALQEEAETSMNRRLRDDNGNEGVILTKYSDAPKRWEAVCRWLSELTPRPITQVETISAPTGEVIFAVREDPYADPIPAPSLSDGTLRFAALALAAIGIQGRRTLAIEEIENGINPTRLSLLIRMLEQAAEPAKRGQDSDVQVIASTHSPSILDYASAETIKNSIIIGWDSDHMSSHPMKVADLPSFGEISTRRTLGELQAEGWLQAAADV